MDADLGVMLSASHNPMPDNGIKFFARGGLKLADDVEDAIEKRLREHWQRPTGAGVGSSVRRRGCRASDTSNTSRRRCPSSLAGARVVVDAANGAASYVGPSACVEPAPTSSPFTTSRMVSISTTHVARRIWSRCVLLLSSTVPMLDLLSMVTPTVAWRFLARARWSTGDHILAILALSMRDGGVLRENTVVSTVMANLGFRLAMDAAGVNVIATSVGDRYVLEAMRDGGFNLGGEQSGHVLMLDHATTGDGILTALQVMARAHVGAQARWESSRA